MYDVSEIRREFPILSREVHGRPLVYLDSAASAQKPRAVIDAVTKSYSQDYSNVHRGLHTLSNLSTEQFEATREKLARFLGAREAEEIIFTRGTTESLNLVAYAYAEPMIQPGDEIVLSIAEHHANIVPWHFLRERRGAKLVWVDMDENGEIPAERVVAAMTERTKIVAITHMSNTLGTVVDVKTIAAAARARGAATVVDGSQAAVHLPLDVADLGVDFYAITGHKLYGPSGSGALYVRREMYDAMRPWHGGGEMIREVTTESVSFADPPHKFEAGTPAITQMIGLGAALDFISEIGLEAIAAHERKLRDYAQERLGALDWLTLHGTAPNKGAIFTFSMAGAHPHDISTIVDRRGVAVRAGHHCAQPLMARLGQTATTRASFAMYNTEAEVDALVEALETCRELLA